ncbi:ABC transporter ATP-binding protein [Rufibacter glacialis]|uniref:ABC transporter ATP-binding protein n=1 Tax=Rufibacter glacialis TaxID=1259555 RepID=A0A5M8QHQ9_9BACT|nr:ATP-binding cassette domain-containing protein [Rufibacter glacialis]KAA6435627.1 ATP-binding cassette domain-containing protein [Rufibacter glacialis]GGK65114.1 ABC transporter ATP-binding protein [Rufibacter glacialis]
MADILEIQGISKRYGAVQALDQVSLNVPQGSIYGLLGPNGSGKTTTLGIVLDVINASAGTFRWFGQPLSKSTKRRIGALLETPNFYPYLTGEENLRLTAEVKGVAPARVGEALQTVGLGNRRGDKFKGYSLGMKQRLAIGAALLGDPEVLVLDEPTNGLDPEGIAEVRRLILHIASQGKTIVLASHLLDEVEKVCTHMAVLRNGKLKAQGPVSSILATNDLVFLNGGAPLETLLQTALALPFVAEARLTDQQIQVTLQNGVDSSELNRAFFAQGIALGQLVVRKKSLESQFLEIIKADHA